MQFKGEECVPTVIMDAKADRTLSMWHMFLEYLDV